MKPLRKIPPGALENLGNEIGTQDDLIELEVVLDSIAASLVRSGFSPRYDKSDYLPLYWVIRELVKSGSLEEEIHVAAKDLDEYVARALYEEHLYEDDILEANEVREVLHNGLVKFFSTL